VLPASTLGHGKCVVFGFLLVSYQLQQPIAFCATVARSPLRLPEDISKFKGTAKMAKMVMVVMVVFAVTMVMMMKKKKMIIMMIMMMMMMMIMIMMTTTMMMMMVVVVMMVILNVILMHVSMSLWQSQW